MTEHERCEGAMAEAVEELTQQGHRHDSAGMDIYRAAFQVGWYKCRSATMGDKSYIGPDPAAVEALVVAATEVQEPGVFGEFHLVRDPAFGEDVEFLCEQFGYGALMSHVMYLWSLKDPNGHHTVAAVASVRRSVLADLRAALAPFQDHGPAT